MLGFLRALLENFTILKRPERERERQALRETLARRPVRS